MFFTQNDILDLYLTIQNIPFLKNPEIVRQHKQHYFFIEAPHARTREDYETKALDNPRGQKHGYLIPLTYTIEEIYTLLKNSYKKGEKEKNTPSVLSGLAGISIKNTDFIINKTISEEYTLRWKKHTASWNCNINPKSLEKTLKNITKIMKMIAVTEHEKINTLQDIKKHFPDIIKACIRKSQEDKHIVPEELLPFYWNSRQSKHFQNTTHTITNLSFSKETHIIENLNPKSFLNKVGLKIKEKENHINVIPGEKETKITISCHKRKELYCFHLMNHKDLNVLMKTFITCLHHIITERKFVDYTLIDALNTHPKPEKTTVNFQRLYEDCLKDLIIAHP